MERVRATTQLDAATPSTGVDATGERISPLKGMGYDEQVESLRPSDSASGGGNSSSLVVSGPMGRLFNRILGVEENRTDTGKMKFKESQLRDYLSETLNFAEREMFRSAKVGGVSKKLVETLDTDGDKKVGWPEFQNFAEQVLQNLAPGANAKTSPEAIKRSAAMRYSELGAGSSGESLGYNELKDGTHAALPEGTDHADLIAQLGARVALDTIDSDGRSVRNADRTLTQEEWLLAASEMARQLYQ